MLKLYQAANLPEAHLVLHRLEQAGIQARIFNDHAQGGMGEIPFTHTYPEVWLLDADDQARARQLIAAFEQADAGAPTVCPRCAEENPPAFEICWQCGASVK